MNLTYNAKKVLACLVLLALFLLVYSFAIPEGTPWLGKDGHLSALAGGLITGFIVLVVQFVVDNNQSTHLQELKDTRILRVLESRDDEEYYRALLIKAKTRVIVSGVTARRFLDDFADSAHTKETKKVLIRALERGVQVQLLVAKKAHLSANKHADVDRTRERLDELVKIFPSSAKGSVGRIELKYYDHASTHSMVVVDEDCLVGPVFSGVESKHSPTIHAKADGNFADAYLQNFESAWKNASKNA